MNKEQFRAMQAAPEDSRTRLKAELQTKTREPVFRRCAQSCASEFRIYAGYNSPTGL